MAVPLLRSRQKISNYGMQALQTSAVKQLVDWMLPKMEAFAVLTLVNCSEPARVEEYTNRIKTSPSLHPLSAVDEAWAAERADDALAAKRDALTGIGHCIFSQSRAERRPPRAVACKWTCKCWSL